MKWNYYRSALRRNLEKPTNSYILSDAEPAPVALPGHVVELIVSVAADTKEQATNLIIEQTCADCFRRKSVCDGEKLEALEKMAGMARDYADMLTRVAGEMKGKPHVDSTGTVVPPLVPMTEEEIEALYLKSHGNTHLD